MRSCQIRHPGYTFLHIAALLISWLYDRLYRELAWVYDPVSWLVSGGRWQRWQAMAVPYLLGKRVIEIGTGPGHLLANLLTAGYDAYGVELSPSMVRLAQNRLRRNGWQSRLVRGDAHCLPFAVESFDSAITTFPASFVLEQAFSVEIHRVLRPGGKLVVLIGAESQCWPWPGVVEWILRHRQRHEATEAIEVPSTGFHWQSVEERGPLGVVWLLLGSREGATSEAVDGPKFWKGFG